VTTAGQPPSLTTPGLGVWRHTVGHSYRAVSEAYVFHFASACWGNFAYAHSLLTHLPMFIGSGATTYPDQAKTRVVTKRFQQTCATLNIWRVMAGIKAPHSKSWLARFSISYCKILGCHGRGRGFESRRSRQMSCRSS
jgi:hypothetical protein